MVLLGTISTKDGWRTVHTSNGLPEKGGELVLGLVQTNHDIVRIGNGEDSDVAVACCRKILGAHVDKVNIPHALDLIVRWRWCIVLGDVAVLTFMTGMARFSNGMIDANAVFTELRNLGDVHMVQAKMPEFCVSKGTRVRRAREVLWTQRS